MELMEEDNLIEEEVVTTPTIEPMEEEERGQEGLRAGKPWNLWRKCWEN
jgi:hypothetical protein